MASATVNSNAADIDLPLQLDSVPAIDLSLISQSELYSLSLCSSSPFDNHRCGGGGDLVNPKIDRSVFNESAGSRKQTYSRLRLAPATSSSSPSALRRRGPVIRSTNFNAPLQSPDSDSEVVESRQIVGLLKGLFGAEDISIDSSDDYTEVGKQIIPTRVDYSDAALSRPSELNRKMGRLPEHKISNALAPCESDVVRMTVDANDVHENALVGNKAKAPCESDMVRMDVDVNVNDIHENAVMGNKAKAPCESEVVRMDVDANDIHENAFVGNKAKAPCESDVVRMAVDANDKHENAVMGNKAKAPCESESDMVRMTVDANDIHENVEDRFDVFEYKDDDDLAQNKDDVDVVENKDVVDHLVLIENKDDVHVENNKDDVDLVENNKDVVDDLVDVHVENKEESTLETNTVVIGLTSEIVAQQNVDDRDMEMVNRDGIMVDLVGLGFVEDPYAEELGKRTKGMSREEELLAFLSGLRGEWVSRRKKRRIVDASEFGNALPKGWRLMLACKKKGGGVWLFCRRYLSPNGRQFVSCKEISAYLLSLQGSHGANQMSCDQHNLNVGENNMDAHPADKFDVTNTAVLVVSNESREENDVSRFLSQAFASMSGDYGVQVYMGAPDQQPVVQAGSSNDDKCNLISNYADGLLHQQVSSHRRKKSKVSVTDGVIIKEGKFECQFCHKVFDERKRYNGHMGSHVRGQIKIPDESRPKDVRDTVSIDNNHYRDPVVLPPTGTDNTVVSIVTGKHGGDESNSDLPPHGSADQLSWNTEAYVDKMKFDDTMTVDASETNEALRFESDAALSNSENNHQPEIPGCTNISNVAADGNENPCNEQETFSEGCSALLLDKQRTSLVSNEVAIGSEKSCNEQTRISEGSSSIPFDKRAGNFISNEAADGIDKCSNEQERTSEGCSPLPLDKHSGGFSDAYDSEKCCNEQDGTSDGCSPNPLHNQAGCFDDMINGLFESNRETISGSALHGSNENLESCDIDWDSTDFSHAIDGFGISEDKIMGNDPVLDFSGKSGVDGSSFDVGKLHSGFKYSSCVDVNLVKGKSISISEGSQQKIVFEENKLVSSCGKEIEKNKDVYGLFTASGLVMDEHDKVHIYESKDHTRSAEFDRAAMNSLEKPHTEFPLGDLKARQQSKTFNSLFTSLSSVGGSIGVDNHADNLPSKVIQEHQVIDTQINDSTGLRFPFPRSNNVPTMPTVVSDDKEKIQFGFRSFFPSENRQQFAADGNRLNRQSSVVVESKDRSLGGSSCAMGSPHEVYSSNKMFPTQQLNEHGTIVDKNPKSNGLCLAFDSQESSSVNQLEQYGTKSFGIHHGMPQAYGVPHNLNNFGLGAAGNSMEGRGFGTDMHDSSFSDKSSKFENSFDLSYPSRIWDGARVDATVNSSNKFMVDFVNRNTQPSGDVMAGSMWRSGDVNLLQHDLANARPPIVQSSNSFHTFDIISEKGHHGGLYEVNQKYNTSGDFEGLRLGRTEPTEYTFMATQNSNTLSRDSKGLSYNVHSQPDFNPSFWLGKDALMPSMTTTAQQNRVPTICVWCRNEFYEEATPSAAQAGAIGSMCSTCSSGISHHLNVL